VAETLFAWLGSPWFWAFGAPIIGTLTAAGAQTITRVADLDNYKWDVVQIGVPLCLANISGSWTALRALASGEAGSSLMTWTFLSSFLLLICVVVQMLIFRSAVRVNALPRRFASRRFAETLVSFVIGVLALGVGAFVIVTELSQRGGAG
jgi:hypothetical protein